MTKSVSIKIQPQFVETSQEIFRGRRLHKIQQVLLQYDDLSELTIISAPTGTGKSFAFPLPIVQFREATSGFSKRRCIIVSPTNALIEDMEKEYTTNFPELNISKLNRQKLDELNAKGPDRWNMLLQVIKEHEVIITNPDLLNFALFGGYYRHKGQKEISEIFAYLDYFVFDEYHLYDEEQIANILSWIAIKKALIAKPVKFIFASATPEKELNEVLKSQGFSPVEIIETISEKETPDSRKIHGEIEVTFLNNSSPFQYLLSSADVIHDFINRGERILVIFEKMVDLRKARSEIENRFCNVAVSEVSGYFTKSGVQEKPGEAALVLGTNKIEVGVNLDVSICLMQTGRYFANFVQRFGRIARQGKDGKAIVFLENKIREIEEAFSGKEILSYYDFIEQCRSIELLSDNKFYSEKIPRFLGAYYFVIAKNIKDYATQRLFMKNLRMDGQIGFMFGVMKKIEKAINNIERINTKTGKRFNFDFRNWKKWWEIFLSTFKYFRASSPNVLVRDLTFGNQGIITKYSLEWTLKNREVVGEESVNGERCLVVSCFLEGKQELQYYVESLPVYKLSEDTLYLQQKEKYCLKQAFESRIAKIANNFYQENTIFNNAARNLIIEVEKLNCVMSEKRLVINDIRTYSNII